MVRSAVPSDILRTLLLGAQLISATLLETWPSGRRHAPAKGASGQNPDPGFESLRLRQVPSK
jgi:hypothetical protein